MFSERINEIPQYTLTVSKELTGEVVQVEEGKKRKFGRELV